MADVFAQIFIAGAAVIAAGIGIDAFTKVVHRD